VAIPATIIAAEGVLWNIILSVVEDQALMVSHSQAAMAHLGWNQLARRLQRTVLHGLGELADCLTQHDASEPVTVDRAAAPPMQLEWPPLTEVSATTMGRDSEIG
jgi:hypothetical protein